MQTCETFREAAQRFAAVGTSDASKLATIRADALELHEHADKVLNADYTGIYDRD